MPLVSVLFHRLYFRFMLKHVETLIYSAVLCMSFTWVFVCTIFVDSRNKPTNTHDNRSRTQNQRAWRWFRNLKACTSSRLMCCWFFFPHKPYDIKMIMLFKESDDIVVEEMRGDYKGNMSIIYIYDSIWGVSTILTTIGNKACKWNSLCMFTPGIYTMNIDLALY